MPKQVYNGVEYDSTEEIEFRIFLDDLTKYGLVIDDDYQPKSYELVPKAERDVLKVLKTKPNRLEKKHLFHRHVYTPDWSVTFSDKFVKDFLETSKLLVIDPDNTAGGVVDNKTYSGKAMCLVDVKGGFNLHGGDRIFPIHQKLMWHVYGLPVNKVIPSEVFTRLKVVPDNLKWMKNRKKQTAKKKYFFIPTIDELYTNKKVPKVP